MGYELILAFHGLGEPPDHIERAERAFWVPVDWLATLLDAARPAGVTIAFDDGNATDIEQALPLLLERGMTARFFPLSGRIERDGYLTAEDIRALRAAGMGIGSQGVDHRPWRTLDDEELQVELNDSRRCFSEILGEEITEAACPFGSYDRRVLKALRAAGYTKVFNSDGSTVASGSWIVPRETVAMNQPLDHWLECVHRNSGRPPGPVKVAKRLLKRLR
jgi:peptidoglycan/xylan/chitin deacetylase (PgdA/CDA1 family)